jgi:pimeloyl-ACP methyl ester carboxylesterase
MIRASALIVLVYLALVGGCARLPDTGVTTIKSATLNDLRGYLLSHKPDLDQFRLRGPFAVSVQISHELNLSTTERIDADLFLSSSAGKAPLVIFLHGYASSKQSHSYQAMHLASWGMHSLTLQLPNNGPWTTNGKTLAKIVEYIHRFPETVDSRIDVRKIILVGHSFGGTSVAIALAEGAPAAGGILLDPAGVGRELPNFLRQVNSPVMLLGADERVSSARNRDFFFRFIRGGIAELSITGAAHEDAQYPSDYASTSEALQMTFVSALTSAAFSLSATDKLDYAWSSFRDAIGDGRLFNAKIK